MTRKNNRSSTSRKSRTSAYSRPWMGPLLAAIEVSGDIPAALTAAGLTFGEVYRARAADPVFDRGMCAAEELVRTFHGLTAVAPLKRGCARRNPRHRGDLSTASPPWPH